MANATGYPIRRHMVVDMRASISESMKVLKYDDSPEKFEREKMPLESVKA